MHLVGFVPAAEAACVRCNWEPRRVDKSGTDFTTIWLEKEWSLCRVPVSRLMSFGTDESARPQQRDWTYGRSVAHRYLPKGHYYPVQVCRRGGDPAEHQWWCYILDLANLRQTCLGNRRGGLSHMLELFDPFWRPNLPAGEDAREAHYPAPGILRALGADCHGRARAAWNTTRLTI